MDSRRPSTRSLLRWVILTRMALRTWAWQHLFHPLQVHTRRTHFIMATRLLMDIFMHHIHPSSQLDTRTMGRPRYWDQSILQLWGRPRPARHLPR